jgi:P27 family predicted phage terminase small subunit
MTTTSKLPANLHIVEERPPKPNELVTISLGPSKWLSDPGAWSQDEFLAEVEQAMRDSHGETVELDRFLLALLVSQAEIYVQCWRNIQVEGLTITYNAGQTPGKNPSVAIADRALRQVVKLLDELGMTPKIRRPSNPKGAYAKLLAGP